MSDIAKAAARIVAHSLGRAIPVVECCSLFPDPKTVFGIAPIRVVSEQRVQAIAFGPLDGTPPQLVTITNPLNRESDELGPFAQALDSYLSGMLRQGLLPRIWLPHVAALEVVDILGHRYRTNRKASALLQRMGSHCRALVEESKYPGQQAVAIANALLCGHVATGQSPIEDSHLGALLAWVDPLAGTDPRVEAIQQSLLPAAAMLDRAADDEVEHLRVIVKKGKGAEAERARERVEEQLRRAAIREWDLLVRARHAFWGLAIPPAPLLDLAEESRERLTFALSNDLSPPSKPHSLARLLYAYELASEQSEDVLTCSDGSVRERARRKGKAMVAEVVEVEQPNRGRHPCTLKLKTNQAVLRVRVGTQLKTLNGQVMGRVLSVHEDGAGGTIVELKLEKGVQARKRPTLGAHIDLVDSVVFDFRFQRAKINAHLKAVAPALLYGDRLPLTTPRKGPLENLAALAAGLRKV